MAKSTWRSSFWLSLRAAPPLLQVASAAFIATLAATAGCMVLASAALASAVFGAFGLVTAVLGIILVLDISGSAAAMERIADSLSAGRLGIAPRRWTAGTYRWLGAVYLIGGCLFAVVGWSGLVR